MTTEDPRDLIDELDNALDRERNALLQGDLEQIGELMLAKERLIENINALQSIEQQQLAAVQKKVTRNQALLASALDGIRAVANRMADLRRVRSGLETYDHQGQKQSFGMQTRPNVEKRA
ncbi:hypothetical protein [Sedimentitalea nanhaiensis]|uniref:FlgN protein n=1 Tax=Sedimentitalea nanhaiensis TaxID=999627 RepID=A0A1I7CA21_9RHOB|nr:hypothetical protein [Sedimentitalea nanhaiensis]SFT96275.1 hypothetical protein SAMN05216236_11571 [Sedimentitalea nanhaiensis]